MGMIGYYLALDSEDIEKIKNEELDIFDFMYNGKKYNEEYSLDIDKTWHALYYILSKISGDDENLRHAVPLDDIFKLNDDIPTFKLDASRVSEISEAVNKITREKMLNNYNIMDMVEFNIYPVVEDEDEDEFFEYMYDYFIRLQEFFSKVASEGKILIFCIV